MWRCWPGPAGLSPSPRPAASQPRRLHSAGWFDPTTGNRSLHRRRSPAGAALVCAGDTVHTAAAEKLVPKVPRELPPFAEPIALLWILSVGAPDTKDRSLSTHC